MCNTKRMGPSILLGLVVILLLSAVSAQASRAFVCTTPNRLGNPAFDTVPLGFAPFWTAFLWTFGGPSFTPPGSVFHFFSPAVPGNFLTQTLAGPGVFAEHVDTEIENGDGTATWLFTVGYTDATITTTLFTHLGPADPGVVPPPPPGSGAYKHFDAAFVATRCIRSIRITQASGAGPPTCTDNYRVCGWTCRTIDIKPGSDPNCINPKSSGTVAVAILSTPGFDATAVSCASLTFGPAGAPALRCATEDVDLDGDLDLVAHFQVSATGITASTTEACLTGVDGSGDAFKACDAVCIPPGGADP
ncbi:MAG: hypothetical protein ACRD2M_08205 [Terriglobales bacterium]